MTVLDYILSFSLGFIIALMAYMGTYLIDYLNLKNSNHMKTLLISIALIFTFFFASAQDKPLKEVLAEIALDEGIDAKALYKYRKANLHLTRKGTPEFPYSFYDVPVTAPHGRQISFKSDQDVRFYRTIPDMYRDVCRFFYHQGKFLIPEHEKSLGGELKFQEKKYVFMANTPYTCNDKGGCKMPDPETNTEKDKKKAIALFEDKRDLIISYCKIQKQYIPENAGLETVSISSILNKMQLFIDEMKMDHLPALDKAETKIYP